MPLSSTDGDAPSFRRRIAAPRLQQLYDYWLARCSDRWAMLRADLDPTLIPALLRNLILADVANDGHDIRYRLVGTEIVTAHGLEYTGMSVEQLTSGTTLAYTRQLYHSVVSRSVPVYSEGQFQWTDREFRWTKRLHLPMSWDGSSVDLVLAGQIFETEHPDDSEQMIVAHPSELESDRGRLEESCRITTD